MDIMLSAEIETTPEQLYDALTTPEGLAGWWKPMVSKTAARVGEVLEFHHHGTVVLSFRVEELEAARRIVWSCVTIPGAWNEAWEGTRVIFEILSKENGAVTLRFRHTGFAPEYDLFDYLAYGWAQYVRSVKMLLETGRGEPWGSSGSIAAGTTFRSDVREETPMPDVRTFSTVVERQIDATPAQVFAALSEPERILQWWRDEALYFTEGWEHEPRVGGRIRHFGHFIATVQGGRPFEGIGTYRVIDPSRVLEYTRLYPDAIPIAEETVIRYELTPSGAGTHLRISHSGFHTEEGRDMHRQGWLRVLDWLSAYLQKEQPRKNVLFGNHSAVRVRRAERDRIRRFYRDVLGCKIAREFDGKDDVRIGDDYHIAFLYESGGGRATDEGVTYAAADALSDDDFMKAIFLELKTDDVEKMRQNIVAFGVKVLDVPDPHLYFQAPGGQVFRLVGIDEDLSRYEGDR